MDWATTDKPDFEFPPHVYSREIDDQMVLLNLETEQYFGLDAVGADIVNRLTRQSAERALTGLVDDYDVDPDVLRRDFDDLIDKLLTEGLLKRVERGP